MKLSLVVPCYNEADSVALFQDAVIEAFHDCGYGYDDEEEQEVSNEDFIDWLKENDAPNYLVQLAERVLGL